MKFRAFSLGGGSTPGRFSDNFATDDNTGRPNWISGFTAGTGGPLFTFNVQLQVNGGGASPRAAFAVPMTAPFNGTSIVSQYCKANYVTTVNSLARGGPAVLLAGQPALGGFSLQGYMLQMVVDGNTANLSNVIDQGNALAPNVLVPADGDIYELQVDCSLTFNRVRLWQNGTLMADVNDSKANRPETCGLCGFYYDNVSIGCTQKWSNFVTQVQRS